MKGPPGMALALRPWNRVPPRQPESGGAVMGRRREAKSGEPGQLAAWVRRVIQAVDLDVPLSCEQSPAGQ